MSYKTLVLPLGRRISVVVSRGSRFSVFVIFYMAYYYLFMVYLYDLLFMASLNNYLTSIV